MKIHIENFRDIEKPVDIEKDDIDNYLNSSLYVMHPNYKVKDAGVY